MIGSIIGLVLTVGTIVSNCTINSLNSNDEITYKSKTKDFTSIIWHNNDNS